MFGIGFWEIILIFIIGLAVLGPEKSVAGAKKLRRWWANLHRELEDLKKDLGDAEE